MIVNLYGMIMGLTEIRITVSASGTNMAPMEMSIAVILHGMTILQMYQALLIVRGIIMARLTPLIKMRLLEIYVSLLHQ